MTNIHGIVMNIDVQRPHVLSSYRTAMNIHGIAMNIVVQRPPVLSSCRAVALSTPEDGAHTSLWSGSLAGHIYGLTDWCLGRTDCRCLATDERQRTGTCPYGLVLPAWKIAQKKWKTCAGNYYRKCDLVWENCAKIVPMFYSASLIENDHDE